MPQLTIPRSQRQFTVQELETNKIRHHGFLMQTTFKDTKNFAISIEPGNMEKPMWNFTVDFIAYATNIKEFTKTEKEETELQIFPTDAFHNDNFVHIFQFLHDRDLENVRLVCKSFNNLCNTEFMYKSRCKNAFSVHDDQVTTTWKQFYNHLMTNFIFPRSTNENVTATYTLVYRIASNVDLEHYDEQPLKDAYAKFCSIIFGGTPQYIGCTSIVSRQNREFITTLYFGETTWQMIPQDEIPTGEFDFGGETSWSLLVMILLNNIEQLLPAMNLAGVISDSYCVSGNSAFKSVILGDVPRYLCGVDVDESALKDGIRQDPEWTKNNITLLADVIPEAKIIAINTKKACVSFRFDEDEIGFPYFDKLAQALGKEVDEAPATTYEPVYYSAEEF